MDWEQTLRKKSDQKNKKKSKNQSKIAACEQKKPLGRKRIFVQTPFSHLTLNLEQKKLTQQNHSLFRSTSCSA